MLSVFWPPYKPKLGRSRKLGCPSLIQACDGVATFSLDFVGILSAFYVTANVCVCVCVACIVPYNTSSSSWLFSHAPTHKILHWKETIKPPSFADAETWRYPPFDNLLIFFFFFLADSVQYIYRVL